MCRVLGKGSHRTKLPQTVIVCHPSILSKELQSRSGDLLFFLVSACISPNPVLATESSWDFQSEL
jgi:hypothetical protein